MTFTCSHCHAPLTPGSQVCGNCGLHFDAPVPVAARPPARNRPSPESNSFSVTGCLWWVFLAFLFICAIIVGTWGDVILFWVVLVLGLPSLIFNKILTTRLKTGIALFFFVVFGAFSYYSKTPAGRQAYAANQRDTRRRQPVTAPHGKQNATVRQAAERQAQQAKLHMETKLQSSAPQRKLTSLTMPIVTVSDHLEHPDADAAKAFVQRAYPGCAVHSDMYWSGGDNDMSVGYDVTKPNGKKVVAHCQFAPDPGQTADARYPTGYYNLSEEVYQTPAQQEASIGQYSTPATSPDADQSQPSVSSEERKISAYMMAQEFVNDKLKAPGSAKYPEYDGNFVEPLGDNTYQVSAFVDSQNSFGALLRLNWTVVLRDDGDSKWACKHLTLKQQ